MLLSPLLAHAQDAAAIKTFVAANLDLDKQPAGIVVGYVDEHASWIVAHGRVAGRDMDGDTVFEIGSVTKTFTALLLLDMAARGEVGLDDPVAKHLPPSVKVPSRGGKEITLLNLAAQDFGLPFNADNHRGRDWKTRFETCTPEMMYAYLAGHTLTADPGERFQYSNIGAAVLGHVIERRTGKDLNALFAERICTPLGMNSTRIRLTPPKQARLAPGHDAAGKPAPNWDLGVVAGTGGLRSTANDLLEYVAAHVGLTAPSKLTPAIEQSHVMRHRGDSEFGNTAVPWVDECVVQPPGSQLLGHGGRVLGVRRVRLAAPPRVRRAGEPGGQVQRARARVATAPRRAARRATARHDHAEAPARRHRRGPGAGPEEQGGADRQSPRRLARVARGFVSRVGDRRH